MLVLSRKQGQRIHVGSNIEIVVTEIQGGTVRLGISAPPEVPIHREEVYYRVRREQQQEQQQEQQLGRALAKALPLSVNLTLN